MIHRIEYTDRNNVISLYLPEDSVPDKNAVEELHQMTGLEETLERLASIPGFFQEGQERIEKIILTPDFHKGFGIPIGTVMMTKGFVVPQAMGKDINCGMRLYTTDLSEERILDKLPELTKKVRHIFFSRWQADTYDRTTKAGNVSVWFGRLVGNLYGQQKQGLVAVLSA